MRGQSARAVINRLYAARNRFGRQPAAEKQDLLEALPELVIGAAADLKKLHKTLCFIRSFPDNATVYGLASDALASFIERVNTLGTAQRKRLADSGIAATDIQYSFSFEVAAWLARKFPGLTQVDWPEAPDTEKFDELLEHLLEPSESDFFDGGQVSTREWLAIARPRHGATDFDWLMAQLKSRPGSNRFWTALYNSAELPLRCSLANSSLSTTANQLDTRRIAYRSASMHSRVAGAKKLIATPVTSISKLSRRHGTELIDVAMASLAVRHRETLHFNYANADEVYLADVGRGVQVAVTGLMPDKRYPLECTMGFLILSNGVPIGYGGASVLFRQVNTGINIFDEYRGSEAAWMWVQVMRVFNTLTGCNRYIANPYQFGSENNEALKSGAFWFYYRLGYRPVERAIRALARDEFAKLKRKDNYRTPLSTLKRLASCDMHLTLPGARKKECFNENWIEASAALATHRLAATGEQSRSRARRALRIQIMNALGIRSIAAWSTKQKKWLDNLCPLISAIDLREWSADEKRDLIKLVRAKGDTTELRYAQLARNHCRYFSMLMHACKKFD